jgi:stage II sporulation protein D
MRSHAKDKRVVVNYQDGIGRHRETTTCRGAALRYCEMPHFSASHAVRWALMAAALTTAACAGPRVSTPRPSGVSLPDTVRVSVAGRVTRIPLEEYVYGAALSEIVPTGQTPATVQRVYEVQTILARTWSVAHLGRHRAEGFDFCDTTHCQLYEPARTRTSSFRVPAETAARATRGRILLYQQRTIEGLFHADCGGHTALPSQAWGGTNYPYLPAQPDDLGDGPHRTWQFEASLEEWRTTLNRDPRTAVGSQFTGLEVTRTAPGGRVTEVRLTGTAEKRVSGETLRTVVVADRGARSVLSSLFTARRNGATLRLSGRGFGHGVGLCQVGAMARARRGDSVSAILGFYFPGAAIFLPQAGKQN